MSPSQETELVLQDHIHSEKNVYNCPVASKCVYMSTKASALAEGTQSTSLVTREDRNLTPKPGTTTRKGHS